MVPSATPLLCVGGEEDGSDWPKTTGWGKNITNFGTHDELK
jgi:hypothetical protein